MSRFSAPHKPRIKEDRRRRAITLSALGAYVPPECLSNMKERRSNRFLAGGGSWKGKEEPAARVLSKINLMLGGTQGVPRRGGFQAVIAKELSTGKTTPK